MFNERAVDAIIIYSLVLGFVLLAFSLTADDSDAAEQSDNSSSNYVTIDVSVEGRIIPLKYRVGETIAMDPPGIERTLNSNDIVHVLTGFTCNNSKFDFIGFTPSTGKNLLVKAVYKQAVVIK